MEEERGTYRAIRLPDIDMHARDGVAVRVLDGADGEHGLALGVRRHAGAVGEDGRVVRVEGPQHGALSAPLGLGVVDAVDEQGEAEDVGEEDEFLHRGLSVLALLYHPPPFPPYPR